MQVTRQLLQSCFNLPSKRYASLHVGVPNNQDADRLVEKNPK